MERTDAAGELSVIPYLKGEAGGDKTIYEAIGVEPIINCRGTFTIIGGSVERPEVLEAMEAASGYFAQYDELAYAVGERLAEVTGAEWGMISAGCAAGMKHVTIGCVTGGNPEKLVRVPDLTGMDKTQVIVPRYSRNAYDHAVRNAGVELVEVETPQELERAINSRTAMIYIVTGRGSADGQPLSLRSIAGIANPRGIPILADAAAENLTIPNIHLEAGADAVAYSGGKAICGPQCAGLVLGRKDLLMAAWQASAPHHGPGRDDKIGKEEILGMLAAVEAWTTRDHDGEWQMWLERLAVISRRVEDVRTVTTEVTQPADLNNHSPTLVVSWDSEALNITGEEVAEDFARNKPRIAIGSGDEAGRGSVRVTPSQMRLGNEDVVAERLGAILSASRPARRTDMDPAGADLTGQWDLTVRYFTSESRHRLFLRQDGNWLEGTHQSDYSVHPIAGTVEGDEVKMSSAARQPGDNVPFLFSGRVSGDTVSGDVHLGEYLTATFTAERDTTRAARRPILIPAGPPLVT